MLQGKIFYIIQKNLIEMIIQSRGYVYGKNRNVARGKRTIYAK